MSLRTWLHSLFDDDQPAPAPAPAPAKPAAEKPPVQQNPTSQRNAGMPAWKPPANMPAPPQMSQGKKQNLPATGVFKPDPDKVWTPPTPEQKAAPPVMSEGMRLLLNERNWELPTDANSNKQPEGAGLDYEKGGIKELQQHNYTLTNEEWDRIQAAYSTPGAMQAGYVKPADSNLNQNMPLMKLGEQESAALTWEQYDSLSKDQRAAVDFNTLLIQAREDDLSKSHYQSADTKRDYEEKVLKLFGEGRGSDVIAPATVNLLSKLDLNLVGQDLDEFLSLDRAIDESELANFKFSDKDIKTLNTEIEGEKPEYKEVRTVENLGAIDTATIQKAQQMLKTAFQSPEALNYDFSTLAFGPSAEVQLSGQPPMGFGTETDWTNPVDAQKSGYFQSALNLLSTRDLSATPAAGSDPMAWLLSDMKNLEGYDENTQGQFINYLNNQIDLLGKYGTEEQATQAALVAKRAGLGV